MKITISFCKSNWSLHGCAHQIFSMKNINVFIPLLLKSSSSDSKNGSQSSVKSSKVNTGSASDCIKFFWRDLCGSLLVLRGGWAPGCSGNLWGATCVMWTWLTWAGGWSFHPGVVATEKEAECKIRTEAFFKALSTVSTKITMEQVLSFFSRILAKVQQKFVGFTLYNKHTRE